MDGEEAGDFLFRSILQAHEYIVLGSVLATLFVPSNNRF